MKSSHTHILGFQQLLAALVAVGVALHLRVHTGVVPAGQDGHGNAGVQRALQLMGDLRNLLVRTRTEEYLGDLLFGLFFLLFHVGRRAAARAQEARHAGLHVWWGLQVGRKRGDRPSTE